MNRKQLVILSIVLAAMSLLLVALSFVPVYFSSTDPDTGLTAYDSINGILGAKSWWFISFEILFSLFGFISLFKFTRCFAPKAHAIVLLLAFAAVLTLYIVSFNLGKISFVADHSHSPVGFSLFL
jgi:hypothetical protein